MDVQQQHLSVYETAVDSLQKGGRGVYGHTTKVITDFKDFVLRGNVVDLAVAIIVGNAFNAIVKALVGGDSARCSLCHSSSLLEFCSVIWSVLVCAQGLQCGQAMPLEQYSCHAGD